jgi:hypothetical protein
MYLLYLSMYEINCNCVIVYYRHIKLWKGHYCRWNPSMRAQDPLAPRCRELLALRTQLQTQVQNYYNETNKQIGQYKYRHVDSYCRPTYEIGIVGLIIILMTYVYLYFNDSKICSTLHLITSWLL